MKEIYDIVIIGGGTNSLSIASYLGKCGLSVCILEERGECGGGTENTEPMPGYNIDPHATYLYGGMAPAFEQLELHKFGFRMVNFKNMAGGITSDGKSFTFGRYNIGATLESIKKFSKRDAEVMGILINALQGDSIVELLRSIYWTPPPPPQVKLSYNELPWAKLFKETFPLYEDEWNDMCTMDILDNIFEYEGLKVCYAMSTWYNGPHPMWKGTGVFGLGINLTAMYSSGTPRGGMHSLAHALVRCAMYHGTRIYTNCKVEEIIVEDGEAKGVILSDDAVVRNKKIYASKAVISNSHVMRTFLDLVPSRELDKNFIEAVKGLNLKGGSLFVLSLITKEMPKFIGDADETFSNGNYPSVLYITMDSREPMLNMERDVYALNTHPTKLENMIIPIICHDVYDKTRCQVDGHHVFSPIYLQVPPPQYHRDGPLAVNNAQEEITNLIIEKIRQVAPNLTDDKIVAKFVNTPYDSELRNMAFVSANWMGMSQEEEQYYQKEPLPELARYRTPIKNLYLCHQTSYPGGLALQAVSYNLMHILIEDLNLKPDPWWYPSKHFIPSDA